MPHLRFKIVLLGDVKVGKTSLVASSLGEKIASSKHLPSVSIAITETSKFSRSPLSLDVAIWDIPGNETLFRSTIPTCTASAAGIAFVFAVDSRSSFAVLEEMIKLVDENILINRPKILIGNKSDSENRQISRHKAEQFAQKHGMAYVETSTIKNASSAAEALATLVTKIVQIVGVSPDPSLFADKGIELGDDLLHDREHWKRIFGSAALE